MYPRRTRSSVASSSFLLDAGWLVDDIVTIVRAPDMEAAAIASALFPDAQVDVNEVAASSALTLE